jgi:hypothetical protein
MTGGNKNDSCIGEHYPEVGMKKYMGTLLGVVASAAKGYSPRHVPRAEGGSTLMSTQTIEQPRTEIVYPDSDGKPMADNTLQFRRWSSRFIVFLPFVPYFRNG